MIHLPLDEGFLDPMSCCLVVCGAYKAVNFVDVRTFDQLYKNMSA
jgi:hypothetical protein